MLLPLRVRSSLQVLEESLREPQSILTPQALHGSLQPTGEMGTEIKKKDEECLE